MKGKTTKTKKENEGNGKFRGVESGGGEQTKTDMNATRVSTSPGGIIIPAKHPNSKVNRTTEMVPQEAQRQGVTEELGTIAGVNSLRGLTACYHRGRRLNVWYHCFVALRA